MIEHTLLVTETGVEVLTARQENSPGGPIPIPEVANGNANGHANGDANGEVKN
jgi:methionyl aminopeptidase